MEQVYNTLKFSVVIPVYNGVGTIGKAIDAVLAQTYPPHEIIIVDDASTDDTCDHIRQKYPSVKLIEKKINEGSSASRNNGMDMATGDYVSFLDADDIWHNDKLRLLNTVLSKKQDIVLFFHRYTQRDVSGDVLPMDIVPERLTFMRLLPGNFIATSCITIKNIPALRFEPTMRYTEDYDLCLRVCYRYNIYYTNLPLTQIFRGFTTKGGISSDKWKMRNGEMRAYARLAKLNPLFVVLIPMLWAYSLLKHVLKSLG